MFSIYLATNKNNAKRYVGQTKRPVSRRWYHHCWDAETKRMDTLFCRAIRKYGKDAFDLLTIGSVGSQEDADGLERFWIWLFQSNNPEYGYNITPGGPTLPGRDHPCFGRKHSSEEVEARSLRMTGESNPFFGKKHSEEAKTKMSVAKKGKYMGILSPHYGKTASEETKKKQSLARVGKPGPMVGKTHSPETVAILVEKSRRHDVSGEEVSRLYATGMSLRQIAWIFSLSRESVANRLRETGAPIRPVGNSLGGGVTSQTR